jgi:O-antigen/teichoic acid export membrane protein
MSKDGHSFFRHTAIYLLARGLPGVIAFLAIPIYSRLLAPSGYGKYALVLATVNLLGALFFQGLMLALVRYLPAYRDEPLRLKSTLLTAALALVAVGAIVVAVLCAIPGLKVGPAVVVATWLLLGGQQLFDLFCEYARAQIRPWRFMGLQLGRALLATILGAVFIAMGGGWMGAVVGTMVGNLLPAVVAYRRDWTGVRLGIDRDVLRVLCQYAIPLSMTIALAVIISSSDRFLIAWFLGDHAAGLYAATADLTARTLTMLMMSVYSAVFPLAVRLLEERGPEAASERMSENASLMLGVGLPATVGLAILAGNISHCVLGEQFRSAAAGVMPLIAIGALLAGFKGYHLDAAFQFAHRTIHQVWIVAVAALVNIGLNLIAIPRYGINGAGVVSVIALLLSMVMTAWVGRRYFPLKFPFASIARIALAAAVMAAVLWPTREYRGGVALTVQVGVGAAVYGLLLTAMNVLGLRDKVTRRLAAATAGRRRPTSVEPSGAAAALEALS